MAKKTDGSLSSILQQYSAEKEETFTPTGILTIDKLFGGGLYAGGMYAFWGPQGCGKSTVAFQIMKRFAKQDQKSVFLDIEKAFNQAQQEAFGLREYVENGTIAHVTADNYVQVDEICSAIAADGSVKLVVVDSESSLLPKLPQDTDISSAQPGQKARQSQLLLTKVKSLFYQKGIISIWLFHARANISMTANPYAPQEKMAGGWGARHIPDLVLHLNPGQKIKDGDSIQGQVVHLECEKNKYTAPFVKRDVSLYFGVGIKKKQEILDYSVENGLIKQSGSFFTLPNGETIRGRDALNDLTNEQLKVLQQELTDRGVI